MTDEADIDETFFTGESLDVAPCGLVSATVDGDVLWANRRIAEWSGQTAEALAGQRFQDLLSGGGRRAYVDEVQNLVAAGGAATWTIKTELRHVSGTARAVSVTASAHVSGDGQTVINLTVLDLDGGMVEPEKSGERVPERWREEDLGLLIETAAEGIYAINKAGQITLCNAAFLRLLGYDDDSAVLGQSAHALLHHTHADGSPYDEADCPLYAAAAYGRTARVDSEFFYRADGAALPVEYWARPVLRDGVVDGALCTFIDITERRKREDALRQVERQLRRVIDGTVSFISVVDVDGTLREANKALLEAGAVTRDDVLGYKFWDCYWFSFDEEAAAELKADIERAAAGAVVRRDVTIRVAGDRRMTVDFMLAPGQNDGGDVRYLIASGVDVTERLQAERTRNRLAEIVEQSVDFVGTLDVEGRLLYVNRAGLEMTGRALDDVRGLPLVALQPEFEGREIVQQGMRTAAAEGSWTGETVLLDPEGNALPVSLAVLTHKTNDGRLTHYSTVMRDISDLKDTEEHQDFLIREILHRSKNLLAIIQAMASQTARTATSTEHFVRQFKKRVQGLSASHDLLVKQNWQGVPLHDLVAGQLSVFLPSADDPRLTIEGPPVVMTTAAAQALGLALHELGTNAVKYGSLSALDGQLSIKWHIVDVEAGRDADAGRDAHDGQRRLMFEWTERGGPRIDAPVHGGFGRTVIEDMITQSLDCVVVLDYAPEGFRWTMDAPETAMMGPETAAATYWFMPAGGRR